MQTEKNIKVLNNLEAFTIIYHKYEHDKSDNSVMIYDKFKFGIHLTDGLAAVYNEKIINADKGDIFIFSPHEIHFGRFLNSGTFRHLDFYFPLNFFDEFPEEYAGFKYIFGDSSTSRINCIRPNMEDRLKILTLSEKIISLLEQEAPQNDILIFSSVLEILSICSVLYPKQKSTSPTTLNIPHQILTAVSCIKEHFGENISLLEIAKNSGCSVTYLSRVFKDYMGVTVYKYLINYRIAQSTNFLKSGCSVTETAYLCGFGDSSNFIRTFKKTVGISPHQYKLTNLKKRCI